MANRSQRGADTGLISQDTHERKRRRYILVHLNSTHPSPAQLRRLILCPLILYGLETNIINVQRSNVEEVESHAKPQAPTSATALTRSAFVSCIAHATIPLAPMRDQEDPTICHDLPAHVRQEQVVTHDQGHHREGKERDDGEEPAVPGNPDHVPRGVDMDNGADTGNHSKQRHGELVNVHTQVDDEPPGLKQSVKVYEQGPFLTTSINALIESPKNRSNGRNRHLWLASPRRRPSQGQGERHQQGQKRNDDEHRHSDPYLVS